MDRGFIVTTAGIAAGLGMLFAVGALSFDLPCLPGYQGSGLDADLGKGEALLRAAKFSLQNLTDLLPVFAGFAAIFAIALWLPMLVAEHSKSRVFLALAFAPLTVGLALWIALAGPGSDCTQGSIAMQLLFGGAIGSAVLYAAAFICGTFADRA